MGQAFNYFLSPESAEHFLIAGGAFLLLVSVPLAWISRRLSHWIEWAVIIWAVGAFSLGVTFLLFIFNANGIMDNRAYIVGLLLGAALSHFLFIAEHVDQRKEVRSAADQIDRRSFKHRTGTDSGKEKAKFTANFLNSCALAFVGSGLVTSLSGLVVNPSVVPETIVVMSFIVACLVIAIGLHIMARRMI